MYNKTGTQLSSTQLFSKLIRMTCFFPNLFFLDWWAIRERSTRFSLLQMRIREDGRSGQSTCGHTGPIMERSSHAPRRAAMFSSVSPLAKPLSMLFQTQRTTLLPLSNIPAFSSIHDIFSFQKLSSR